MSAENLAKTMDEAEWEWLKPHFERDALILVAQGTSLLQVATEMARDNAAQIGLWIKEGVISKPARELTAEWDKTPGKIFQSIVVQPYVLIQLPVAH